jgi:hypothetical protein
VNSDYEFIYVNVGCTGRVFDGGVIETTNFYDRLKKNRLNLPSNDVTKGNFNFIFVGDDAFVLHKHLLKPLSATNFSTEERVFNYRLSSARRTVENDFGIMAKRFRDKSI